jgi:alpha-tubulin suppressor-like RCC1 family protein
MAMVSMTNFNASTYFKFKALSLSLSLLLAFFLSFFLIGCGGGGGGNESNEDSVTISKIAAGYEHSFVLADDGKVYATGSNSGGQIGLGNQPNKNSFTEVTLPIGANIIDIAAGYKHSLVLSSDSKVYATGYNNKGQLGLGNNDNENNFTEVTLPTSANIIAIAAGDYHSLVLTSDGKVYATGSNSDGQLGLGNNDNKNSFTEVTPPTNANIIDIAAGGDYSFILTSDGKVYATGLNFYGQLGLSNNDNKSSFTEVTLPTSVNIIDIAAGYGHSLVLASDGKVYVTGLNSYGQIGLGNKDNKNSFTEVTLPAGANITGVVAGDYHSFALDSNGSVYATGLDLYGQLGLKNGSDEQHDFTEVTSLNGVSAIAAGYGHSLALTGDGKVYATGRHSEGQLGLGETTDKYISEFTEVKF